MSGGSSTYIVVYADDDKDDLDLVAEAFSRYADNISVISRTNGIEVIKLLTDLVSDNKIPCLVILDINMPKMDGKETLKQIRTEDQLKNVPVVLFTTSSSPADIKFAKHHEAGYLTKPLDARQLESIAEKLIRHCDEEVQKIIFKK